MSWAHAPVAGRRACRMVVADRRARNRWARPRSAVTVWPTAPAAYRSLTGFSRSGGSASSSAAPRLVGSASSGEQARPLAWDLQLVYLSGTVHVRSGGQHTATSTRLEVLNDQPGLFMYSGSPGAGR